MHEQPDSDGQTWVTESGRGDTETYERLAERSDQPDVYTPMGEVAQWGTFAAGARNATGWKRWVVVGLLASFAVPIVVAVVTG